LFEEAGADAASAGEEALPIIIIIIVLLARPPHPSPPLLSPVAASSRTLVLVADALVSSCSPSRASRGGSAPAGVGIDEEIKERRRTKKKQKNK